MMPESAVSKIIKAGLLLGLLLMSCGAVMALFGYYDEQAARNVSYFFTNGAGLLYAGTFSILVTPLAVLLYLSVYFLAVRRYQYSLYCLMIISFLVFVVFARL